MRYIYAIVRFQFHKGTIKTQIDRGLSQQVLYFNSIKVRLKRRITMPQNRRRRKFQFHKGTIKT